MITAAMGPGGHPLTFNATVAGVAVYLDNFAVIDLAEGDVLRRKRFIDALHSGADLLFSVTNAAELAGPRGRSRDVIRTFLDEVGGHWFPVELDPTEVWQRELKGADSAECCISEGFLRSYFADRIRPYDPGTGRIIDLSPDFFRLGGVLDWIEPQRDSILKLSTEFDDMLKGLLFEYRPEYERRRLLLDRRFQTFSASEPAYFSYANLLRLLLAEAHQLKKGDGMDFCHAVLASAFASIAALDKQWKRRVESLPKPNNLAHIYYGPELDKMVADIESCLKHRQAQT